MVPSNNAPVAAIVSAALSTQHNGYHVALDATATLLCNAFQMTSTEHVRSMIETHAADASIHDINLSSIMICAGAACFRTPVSPV